MPVPKTNLFRGDRVKLSPKGIGPKTTQKARERVGTIVTNTLDPKAVFIYVHWDGNRCANRCDSYHPDQLVLYEDEEMAA